jgi:Type II secretion system (T2SS), protein M subtype b
MSERLFSTLKNAAVLSVPFLLAFLAWQIALTPLLELHRDLDEAAERDQGLLQRYRALIAREGEAKAALLRLTEESGADELFYKAANVNAAATLLQQRLGELVAATGGQIRAARVEIKPEATPLGERAAGYETFAVNLTFATSSAGLTKLLFQLETLGPIVLVDHVFVNAGPELLALQHTTNAADKDKRAAEDQVLGVALTASAFVQSFSTSLPLNEKSPAESRARK